MKPKYKLEIKPWGDLYRILFYIDHQSFYVGHDFGTRKEALWYRKQLHSALNRLIDKKGEE